MKLTYIELRGEQHPLCYNLYAIEEMCDEFGDLDAMSAKMNSKKKGEQISAIAKVLEILLDGGREYCKEMGIEIPPRVNNPAALIDATSPEAVRAIFTAIKNDKQTEIEVASKNAVAAQDD